MSDGSGIHLLMTMDASKGVIPLIPWSLANFDQYLYNFCNQIKNVFKSNNSVSLATPEYMTNGWNNHYNPIMFLCNGNIVHYSNNTTDIRYDLKAR